MSEVAAGGLPGLDGEVFPTQDHFEQLWGAGQRVIPVVRRLWADAETPVALYRKLTRNRPGTFLLESAELDGTWSRYSFIGVGSAAMLTEHGFPSAEVTDHELGGRSVVAVTARK